MPPASPADRPSPFSLTRCVDGWLLPVAIPLIVGLWLFTRLSPSPAPEVHEHPPGRQGGVLVSLADDRYHVEALIDSQGWLRIFTLGRDPAEIVDVPLQSPVAYIHSGEFAVSTVQLAPDPQPGDPAGRTSQFSGRLPESLPDAPLQVTVTPLSIAAGRYRLGFAWSGESHLPAMPTKVADEEERELYLTPAGLYTEADIRANGNRTASQKFARFKAEHDFNPQPGDPLCPITRTKANPDCSWQVNGQIYEFCCPPCVDEFVRLAKEQPEKIEPPEAYVQ